MHAYEAIMSHIGLHRRLPGGIFSLLSGGICLLAYGSGCGSHTVKYLIEHLRIEVGNGDRIEMEAWAGWQGCYRPARDGLPAVEIAVWAWDYGSE
jgi:hypothetical protein